MTGGSVVVVVELVVVLVLVVEVLVVEVLVVEVLVVVLGGGGGIVVVVVLVVVVLLVVGGEGGPNGFPPLPLFSPPWRGRVVVVVVVEPGVEVLVVVVDEVLEVEVELLRPWPLPPRFMSSPSWSLPTGDGKSSRRPFNSGFAGFGSSYPYAKCVP